MTMARGGSSIAFHSNRQPLDRAVRVRQRPSPKVVAPDRDRPAHLTAAPLVPDEHLPGRAPTTARPTRLVALSDYDYPLPEGLIARHQRIAESHCPSLQRKKVTPHVLRHTAAMQLLQHGVNR